MAKEYLEREVSLSLNEYDNVWSLKIPDSPHNRSIARPFDFLVIVEGKPIAIECKQTSSLTSFPLDNIRPHQVQSLLFFEKTGGTSYLFVNFRTKGKSSRVFAVSMQQLVQWYFFESRKSIPFTFFNEETIELPRKKFEKGVYGWDFSGMLPEARLKRKGEMQLTLGREQV